MARVTCLFGVAVWLCSISVARTAEILPYTPDDPEDPPSGILKSLNHLKKSILNHTVCDADRFEKMWEAVGRRTVFFDEKLEQLNKAFDDLTRIYGKRSPPVEACSGDYTKAGNRCYLLYDDKRWPWWRSRFYCWLREGELANPKDLEDMRRFLPSEGNDKYWIGGRTSSKLEFPDWMSVDGEKVEIDRHNFTTIPRLSPKANCLAVNGNNSYQVEAIDCEEKFITVCQQRHKGCRTPYELVGDDCLYIGKFYSQEHSWEGAQRECREKKGRLAHIQDFGILHKFVTNDRFISESWTGWLGARREGSHGALKWLDDGSPVTIDPQRHNDTTTGNCLIMTTGTLHTATKDCHSDKSHFICMYDEK